MNNAKLVFTSQIMDGMMSSGWIWVSNVAFAALIIWAIRTAPWHRLRDNHFQHVLFGACATLAAFWAFKAGVSPGLALHHLGATLFTLMFGWQLALLGLSAVLIGVTANGHAGWEALAANGLLDVALPVFVSWIIYRQIVNRLPKNPFVYIFIGGFFGAATAIGLSSVAIFLALWINGVYPLDHLLSEYLPYVPLIMFPEAFMTGGIITFLVILAPRWVSTFDEGVYFSG